MSEKTQGHAVPGLTDMQEHVETVRDWMEEQEEPSDFVFDALRRIEGLAATKDKEIAALETAVADYIAQRDSATERADRNHRRADALEGERDTLRDRVFELREQIDAKDQEIERLKAALDTVHKREEHFRRLYHDEKQESERLRAQVATLIAGQQRNGEARQQARLDMAHELAEMETAARDSAIRRIIDSHEDKP